MFRLALPFAAFTLAVAAHAQTLTVRDTIVALPGISFCQDGATHRTVCTNHRLQPGSLASLVPYENMPLEITGTPGAITCAFVTVQTVTVLSNEQFAMTSTTAATMTVDFFGSGAAGDVYLLFLGSSLATPPSVYPPFAGPVHLGAVGTSFVGVFAPAGATTPYHSMTFPFNSAALGINFFDQCLAIHTSGLIETTVIDCFQF